MERNTKEQDALVERVRAYMEQEHMAERGSSIVAGVSGGADSVCLLLVLAALSGPMDWKIAAVHVNHGIREEAGQDAAYVKELCGRMHIPFYLKEVSVRELARKWGVGEEEAGRRVRYEAFEEAAEHYGAQLVAVAHNRNDRAETLLFHLFRGTGLTGMGSIRPVRGKVIRPLLATGREEIEDWLREKKISWCIDRTNETDTYTRNRIRRHILPFAEREICSEAGLHLAQAAELLGKTADYVDKQARKALERCISLDSEKEVHLLAERFLQEEELIRSHCLKLLLNRLSAGGRDLGQVHVQAVEALFYKQGGRRATLPYGIEAVRSFGEVVLRRAGQGAEDMSKTVGQAEETVGQAGETTGQPLEIVCQEPMEELKKILDRCGSCSIPLPGGRTAEFSVERFSVEKCSVEKSSAKESSAEKSSIEDREKSLIIEQKRYTKWLDYDRIKSLAIRTRRPGDYLAINDRLQKKTLKEYLIQEKIPAYERDDLLLLADGAHILWVIGHRISSAVKVTEATERVLRIYIRGGNEDEGER